ncbi:MAG TPA: hypothetical protein VII85_00335 [Candidatus Krumholzibacteriaceae bacterium]
MGKITVTGTGVAATFVGVQLTYEDFLADVASDLAVAFPTSKVREVIAPRIGLGLDQPMFYVCPGDKCIEYEPCNAEDVTSRVYWPWYDCRIFGLVALTDGNYEDALSGSSSKDGILKLMEDVYKHLVGNFLGLADIREARVTWDQPAFFSASFEGAGVNLYAAMGSLVYRVRLRQVAVLELQIL